MKTAFTELFKIHANRQVNMRLAADMLGWDGRPIRSNFGGCIRDAARTAGKGGAPPGPGVTCVQIGITKMAFRAVDYFRADVAADGPGAVD
jgi:hypothetical protein